MKPNWKDAPKWAQWLAQDFTGTWYWYETKPSPDDEELIWDSAGSGCIQREPRTNYAWRESLEQRPEVQP